MNAVVFQGVKARTAGLVLAFTLSVGLPGRAGGQEVSLPSVAPTHEASLYRRAEQEVQAALLASTDRERDVHLAVAEQVARHLVLTDSLSADAHYWLAVALGIKTEHSGPFQKLTTGREVFFTTARILELDSLHAGGHEMMGRLHAAVMRLPWLVRGLALRMGMGSVLGDASWEQAEHHYQRSAALDPQAIAPRLELAKLYVQQERVDEARPVLLGAARIPPDDAVDEGMLEEARSLLASLDGRAPATQP